MENQLMEMRFEGAAVRIVKDENGEPWFVAKDVCDYFGDSDHKRSVSRLDADEKTLSPIFDSMGRNQQTTIVNEAGLYALLFGFQPEKARYDGGAQSDPQLEARINTIKKFKRWVTHEVIPSIRKTGSYSVQKQLPQNYLEALKELVVYVEKSDRLEGQLALAAPKVEFFDAVASSKDAIEMGKVAKVLDCGIGRNKLFDILRQKQVLMNDNVPYQQYVDRGYFRVVEQKYNTPDGTVHVTTKTLVYQKGLQFILRSLHPALAEAI